MSIKVAGGFVPGSFMGTTVRRVHEPAPTSITYDFTKGWPTGWTNTQSDSPAGAWYFTTDAFHTGQVLSSPPHQDTMSSTITVHFPVAAGHNKADFTFMSQSEAGFDFVNIYVNQSGAVSRIPGTTPSLSTDPRGLIPINNRSGFTLAYNLQYNTVSTSINPGTTNYFVAQYWTDVSVNRGFAGIHIASVRTYKA